MARRIDKDHFDKFHDYGIYIPTRTISIDSPPTDDGEETGVTYAMSNKFIKNFHILESLNASDPITVLLNTEGGDLWQGMAIYDTIRASKCHVIVKVIGLAESMGSIILQAGDERVLMPHSTVMFHFGMHSGFELNPEEAVNQAKHELEYGKRLDEILFERIKEKHDKDNKAFTKAKYWSLNFKGKYMMAQEAVDMGLADRIEQPPAG